MSSAHITSNDFFIPQWIEIRRQLEEINPATCRSTIRWNTVEGELRTVDLSEEMTLLLVRLVQELTEARAIAVQSPDKVLTTTQAAELLQMSRPYLVHLLDTGIIPHHRVGSHRRVLMGDLLKYQASQRLAAIAEMTRISQSMNLY